MSIDATTPRTRVWTAARWWHGATALVAVLFLSCGALAHLADRRLPPMPDEG